MVELLFNGVFYPCRQIVLDIAISVVKVRFIYEWFNYSIASLKCKLIERIRSFCPIAVTRAFQSMNINTHHSLTLFPGSFDLILAPWAISRLTPDQYY